MSDSTLFQLSRIYAGGWGVGRQSADADPAEVDGLADRLNPYMLPAERERWSQGFKDAVSRARNTPVRSRDRLMRTGE
jgi:hypothetical protein